MEIRIGSNAVFRGTPEELKFFFGDILKSPRQATDGFLGNEKKACAILVNCGSGARIHEKLKSVVQNAMALLNAMGIPHAVAAMANELILLKDFDEPGGDIQVHKAMKKIDRISRDEPIPLHRDDGGRDRAADGLGKMKAYLFKQRLKGTINGPLRLALLGFSEEELGSQAVLEELQSLSSRGVEIELMKIILD